MRDIIGAARHIARFWGTDERAHQMNSMTNRCLRSALVGIGLASAACSGEGYAEKGEEDAAKAESELVFGKTETLGSLPTILEGDGDLYTQNGRRTSFLVSAFYVGLEPNNVATYWVQAALQEEFIPDHSRIEFQGLVHSQLPTYWNIDTITCNPIAVSGELRDKSWTYKTAYQDPSPNTTTNCFSYVSIKADGDGWDNTGNAQAKITFSPTITFR